jgi:hypothetical protein
VSVPFWLNDDGDYWVDALEHPDPNEAEGVLDCTIREDEVLHLEGRTKTWLKDCDVDHQCDEDEDCRCDTHENEPCTPGRVMDVWHFTGTIMENSDDN